MQIAIRQAGIEARFVQDGVEATNVLSADPHGFDLVMLDGHMVILPLPSPPPFFVAALRSSASATVTYPFVVAFFAHPFAEGAQKTRVWSCSDPPLLLAPEAVLCCWAAMLFL